MKNLKKDLKSILNNKYASVLDYSIIEWIEEVEQALIENRDHIEIPGRMTKTGNPYLLNIEEEYI
jgi:hypothetical protein